MMSVNVDTHQANTSACLWISSAVIPWVRFSVLTDSVNLGSQNLTSPALLKIAKIVSGKGTSLSNSTSNESCIAAVKDVRRLTWTYLALTILPSEPFWRWTLTTHLLCSLRVITRLKRRTLVSVLHVIHNVYCIQGNTCPL